MVKMTSAYANKVIRKLNEDKTFYRNKEENGYSYIAAVDEEPVIPEYDYSEVAAAIEEIDAKIVKIKHAVNLVNTGNTIDINGKAMTIDEVLVRMSQLSNRKAILDRMRKMEPKSRVETMSYSARKLNPEYRYINFDLDLVKSEYEKIDSEIAAMQIALDKFNQTFEFEVDI